MFDGDSVIARVKQKSGPARVAGGVARVARHSGVRRPAECRRSNSDGG